MNFYWKFKHPFLKTCLKKYVHNYHSSYRWIIILKKGGHSYLNGFDIKMMMKSNAIIYFWILGLIRNMVKFIEIWLPAFFKYNDLSTTSVLLETYQNFRALIYLLTYRKVSSRSTSWFVAHPSISEYLWRGNLMLMYCDFWLKFSKIE